MLTSAGPFSMIKTPENILIVKPSSLGDIVHSLPFLNVLKKRFPGAAVDWVVARGLEGLLEGHPMIRELIIIEKDKWKIPKNGPETLREIKKLHGELRLKKYDIVADLQGLLRSGLITMATRAPIRIGFAEAREGSTLFYTRRVRCEREIHAVDRYLKMAESLGCDIGEVIFPFPQVNNNEETKERNAGLKRYAVLVPGGRWKTKLWPAENFGKIASMLPVKSLVIGGKSEIGLSEEIVRISAGKASSLSGKTTLLELIDIIKQAEFVLSNDSGPMHIAAAFNVPVVALFGPTSPVRTGPYGKNHIVITSPADCSPCFKKTCRSIKCMREITVEMVYKKLESGLFQGLIEAI